MSWLKDDSGWLVLILEWNRLLETMLMSRKIPSLIALFVLLHAPAALSGQSIDSLDHRKWNDLVSRLGTPTVECRVQAQESEQSKAITEIKRRILANELSDDQWNDLLIPERLFRWRPTWLRGEPLVVQLVNPPWLGMSFEIRAIPRLANGKTLRAGRTWAGPCGLANSNLRSREPKFDGIESCGPVGLLADSDSTVVFDVEIRTGADHNSHALRSYSSRLWGESRVVRKAEVALNVCQVDVATEVCKPTEPADANCDVGLVIRPTVYHHNWWDGSMHAYLLVDLDRRTDQCPEVGFGLVVELLKDGQVVESTDLPGWTFWECSTGCLSAGGDHMFEALLNKNIELRDPEQMKRWSLRIKGVDRMAWTAWSYSTYWNGESIVPLADVYKDERAQQLGFTTIRIGGQTNEE